MKKKLFSMGMLCKTFTIVAIMASLSCKKEKNEAAVAETETEVPVKTDANVLVKGATGSHDPSALVTDGSITITFNFTKLVKLTSLIKSST